MKTELQPTILTSQTKTEEPVRPPSQGSGILAAQITGAHGVSGNVRVRLIGANAEVAAQALRNAGILDAVHENGTGRKLTLSSLRRQVQAKGAWIASFREVSGRSGAEELYGYSLYVPEACLPKLPEGEYYVDQLLGIEVVTDAGRSFGNLVEILHTPANDVYVTSLGAMVPAVAAFVKSVDIPGKQIVVTDVPGLLDT